MSNRKRIIVAVTLIAAFGFVAAGLGSGTPKPAISWQAHSEVIDAVAFSANGQRLASIGRDKTLQLWELSNSKLLGKFGTTSIYGSLAFSPKSDWLACGFDKRVVLLDVNDLHEKKSLDFDFEVSCLAASTDGKQVVVGGGEVNFRDESKTFGRVCVLDAESGEAKFQSEALREPLQAIAMSHDGEWLAYSDNKSPPMLLKWQSENAKPVSFGKGPASQLCFLADGKSLAVHSDRDLPNLSVWSFPDPKSERDIAPVGTPMANCSAISGDGKWFAFATVSNTFFGKTPKHGLQLFEVQNSMPVLDVSFGNGLLGGKLHVTSIAFSPKTDSFVVGLSSGEIRHWRLSDFAKTP